MLTDALRHLVGKQVAILTKSPFVYMGKYQPAGFFEPVVKSIENPGVVLDDGSFMPWSNISSIAPLNSQQS